MTARIDSTPPRPQPLPRSAFAAFRTLGTRWMDNDVYGHLNNVVHYSLFDTAVNGWLIEQGLLDPLSGPMIGFVVHTECHYFEPLAFPMPVQAGLALEKLGTSSVRYRIGLFDGDAPTCAALGRFTHVYVERASRRPAPLSDPMRAALARLHTSTTTPA
jgi:acyl-CoA thioester hydrolase